MFDLVPYLSVLQSPVQVLERSQEAHPGRAIQRINVSYAGETDIILTSSSSSVKVWVASFFTPRTVTSSRFHYTQADECLDIWSKPLEVPAPASIDADGDNLIVSSTHWLSEPVVREARVVTGRLICTYLWHGIVYVFIILFRITMSDQTNADAGI